MPHGCSRTPAASRHTAISARSGTPVAARSSPTRSIAEGALRGGRRAAGQLRHRGERAVPRRDGARVIPGQTGSARSPRALDAERALRRGPQPPGSDLGAAGVADAVAALLELRERALDAGLGDLEA